MSHTSDHGDECPICRERDEREANALLSDDSSVYRAVKKEEK